MNSSTLNNRLHYLDAARAFALLLGVLFHASLSFVPVFIGWAVMDISTSAIVTKFLLISHSFRLELFFLIAGFFSHMTFHQNGTRSFLHSRLLRIVIPLVLGWFLLQPLVTASWIMGAESLRGEVHILNGLKAGFQALADLPTGFLTGSHLWFLYYLLLISAIVLVGRFVIGLWLGGNSPLTKWTDRMVAWLAKSHVSVLVLSVPTAACLWYMDSWGVDTPDKSLVPHLPVLMVYGGFFTLGWLLHRQQGLIEQFARITLPRVIICSVSVAASIKLSGYQGAMGHPHLALIHAGFLFSYAMMMWSLVALCIGLFKRLFDRPSRVVRYIADSSYWLYLVHLPIVIWLQIAFAELGFHWLFKFFAISLLTVVISLILYDLLVRSTLIGKTLNGRRKERVLFRRFDRRGGLQ